MSRLRQFDLLPRDLLLDRSFGFSTISSNSIWLQQCVEQRLLIVQIRAFQWLTPSQTAPPLPFPRSPFSFCAVFYSEAFARCPIPVTRSLKAG